jgi:hypothetical protein
MWRCSAETSLMNTRRGMAMRQRSLSSGRLGLTEARRCEGKTCLGAARHNLSIVAALGGAHDVSGDMVAVVLNDEAWALV